MNQVNKVTGLRLPTTLPKRLVKRGVEGVDADKKAWTVALNQRRVIALGGFRQQPFKQVVYDVEPPCFFSFVQGSPFTLRIASARSDFDSRAS